MRSGGFVQEIKGNGAPDMRLGRQCPSRVLRKIPMNFNDLFLPRPYPLFANVDFKWPKCGPPTAYTILCLFLALRFERGADLINDIISPTDPNRCFSHAFRDATTIDSDEFGTFRA